MREIRPSGSEGGGAARSPYPYHFHPRWRAPMAQKFRTLTWVGVGKSAGTF